MSGAAVGSKHLVVSRGVAVVAVYPLLVAWFALDVLVYVHGKCRVRKTLPILCLWFASPGGILM